MRPAAAASLWGKTWILALERRQPSDDAGVVELVRDDVVLGREDGGHGARVGGEAGLNTTQASTRLKSAMRRSSSRWMLMVPAMEANRARAGAVAARGLDRRFDELGMIGQAQVVVGCQVDHFPAIDAANGLAGGLEFAQRLVSARLLPALNLPAEILEWIVHDAPWSDCRSG